MFAGLPAAAAAPETAASVPVMVVLDASGSMNQSDAPGPRIDAAKTAVKNLVQGLPDGTQVGLAVYGTSTGSSDAEKDAGCQDITTLAPVSTLDRGRLTTAVDGVVASGYTPIGNALRAAAAALPTEGPRSIVLVSDGEDTCAPPAPCDVAKELKQQGVDLVVHTVGFKVDQTARDQLSCIADATGGTYSDAADAGQLDQALQVKVDYAITGYNPQGTPVTGADQLSAQAPLLAPGQYVDTYALGGSSEPDGPQGTRKYYTVPAVEGSTLYVSATIVPPARPAGQGAADIKTLGVDLRLRTPDNKSCAYQHGYDLVSNERQTPVTTVMRTVIGSSSTANCLTGDTAILEVQRYFEAYHDEALPIELVVRVEPPADASAVPPPSKDALPGLPLLAHASSPVPITGGSSFNDAPEVSSGATYSDSITTGENRYYRIPLEWGQRFDYILTEVGPATPKLGVPSLTGVDVYNPARAKASMTSWDTSGQPWFAGQEHDPFNGSTRYPVRYTNRDSTVAAEYSLDGFYYLRLNADFDNEPSSTSYLLTVEVVGDPEPGPVYQPLGSTATSSSVTSSATSSTATSTSSSTAPSSTGKTTGASTSAAAGLSSAPTTGTTLTAAGENSGTSSTWIYAVGAAVALLGGAGVLFAVWRGRRGQTGRPPS